MVQSPRILNSQLNWIYSYDRFGVFSVVCVILCEKGCEGGHRQ